MHSHRRRPFFVPALLAAFLLTLFVAVPATPAAAQADPRINEAVLNHTGTDDFEYVEVVGTPNTDYSAFTVLELEGDGSGAGVIDGVFPVGTTDGLGFWDTGFLSNELENGTVTLLLVEGFTGTAGQEPAEETDSAPPETRHALLLDVDGVLGCEPVTAPVVRPVKFESSPAVI